MTLYMYNYIDTTLKSGNYSHKRRRFSVEKGAKICVSTLINWQSSTFLPINSIYKGTYNAKVKRTWIIEKDKLLFFKIYDQGNLFLKKKTSGHEQSSEDKKSKPSVTWGSFFGEISCLVFKTGIGCQGKMCEKELFRMSQLSHALRAMTPL